MKQLSFDDLETWKPVPGYEGFYEASTLGHIRSLPHYVRSNGGARRLSPGKVLAGGPRQGRGGRAGEAPAAQRR